jgi:hypothetical protein
MLIESAINNKNIEEKHLINNTYNALNYINDMYYEDGYFITKSMLETIKRVLKLSLNVIKNTNDIFEDYLTLFNEVKIIYMAPKIQLSGIM